MNASRCLALATAVFRLAVPAHAWNERGHILSAMVAYKDRTPAVREQVDTILRAHPQPTFWPWAGLTPAPTPCYVFDRAAVWPDLIRKPDNPLSASEHQAQWNYINFPIVFDGSKTPTPQIKWDGNNNPANLLQAVGRTKVDLSNTANTAGLPAGS